MISERLCDTGVMPDENSHHKNKLHFKMFSKKKMVKFKIIKLI